MFKPITEYVEGAACAFCWGIGKTFGDVTTPKRIEITGSGFAGVWSPCNGTFIAEQEIGFPNRYHIDDPVVYGSWIVGPVNTAFVMGVNGEGDGYAKNEGLCILISTDAGKIVTVVIAEPPTPGYKIAIDQNFSPSLQTHFLNLGPANGDEVLVLARRRDRVKLHVRYEPEY